MAVLLNTTGILETFQAEIRLFRGLQTDGKQAVKCRAIPLSINKKAPKYFYLRASKTVLEKGVEPLRLAARDPKSRVSANSTTQAKLKHFRKYDSAKKCKLYYRKNPRNETFGIFLLREISRNNSNFCTN